MRYIRKEDIDDTKTHIYQTNIKLDNYDMYCVKITLRNGNKKSFRVFTDKGALPDVDSLEFKNINKNFRSEILKFLAGRLFGPEGLIVKEGRDDYIYLGGNFQKNGFLADRHEIKSNGKTGQQNFDNDLWKIKMRVETQERQKQSNKSNKSNENNGKHYVISDIHGMYGSYMEVVERLNKDDHLYILGDAIDRGKGGIKIIQDIMQRQKNPGRNPKIKFLIGNHELMFIRTVLIMQKYKISKSELIAIINNDKIKRTIGGINLRIYDCKNLNKTKDVRMYEEQLVQFKESTKGMKEYYDDIISSKNINEHDIGIIQNWINDNHGDTTIFNYLDIGKQQMQKVYEFFANSYVVLPENIRGTNILFVHAVPPKDKNMISEMITTYKGYKPYDLAISDIKFMVEERDNEAYKESRNQGFITMCGHTPELGNIQSHKDKGYIRIDAGCGHGRGLNNGRAKLALYCIEDDRVEYIDEKEEYKAHNVGDSR